MGMIQRGMIGAVAWAVCGMCYGQAERVVVDIKVQPIRTALKALGEQTGLQVLFRQDDVEREGDAPAVKGELPIGEALDRLLANSSLKYEFVNARTIRVSAAEKTTGSVGSDERIRVVQAEQAVGSGDGQGEEDKELELEEIVVTGTHIRTATPVAAPMLTMTREEIQRQGYGSLQDLFQALPQNLAELTPASTFGVGTARLSSANSEGASSISLRGLGPGSTLVLLNGQRRPGNIQGRVFDISAIPLSAIDHVEILTGGYSAIYGSDAVAGVVNIVTRHDFQGAESQVEYGNGDSGADHVQLSQTFGMQADRGGFLVAYDYSNTKRLDATSADVARLSRFGILVTPGGYDLSPDIHRHSGLFSGSLRLADSVNASIDALYSQIKNESSNGFGAPAFPGFSYSQVQENFAEEYSVSPALRVRLNDNWQLNASGIYGKTTNDEALSVSGVTTKFPESADLSTLSVALDGSLLESRAANIKSALGAESRWEGVDYASADIHENRAVRSVFAELHVGLLPAEQEHRRDRLLLSISARYSDYSDFGSSTSPQVGLRFNALPSLSLRGSYARAFRAPDLATANDAYQQAILSDPIPDPLSSTGASSTLVLSGNNPALRPERANTWSIGLDFAPSESRLKSSLQYFEIHYKQRIDVPTLDTTSFLVNADRYPGLINRTPTEADIEAIAARVSAAGGIQNQSTTPFDPQTQDILSVFPGLVVFDNRFNNIAVQRVTGMDLTLDAKFDRGLSSFPVALNAVYYVDFDKQFGPASPVTSELDSPGKPVQFRARASAGWTRSRLGAFAYMNYVDRYADPYLDPTRAVSSWLTADVALQYGPPRDGAPDDGISATLSVRNVFDRAPPAVLSSVFGISYDPTNADALGRYITLSLKKRW